MAYLRRRGNQLAIVKGEREPGTGKVRQRILFAIYSKAEAREILGDSRDTRRLEHLLQREHPDVKLNWKAIRRGIQENLDALPDSYEYKSERLRGRFREDLCAFARQLILADPQDLTSAASLIDEQRHELEYLAGLIKWRLELRQQKPSEWNTDNPYYWRFTLQGREVPSDIEEEAAGFYERGEYERANAIFRLLIECFDGYAEGYNYLGLIAFAQRRLDDAIQHFEKTIELGRKLFPARIGKKRYWSDLETRPYMRGLRNLTLSFIQAGRFDDALKLCDRLENECGDDFTAAAHRASIHLNTRKWEQAVEFARRSGGDLDPSAHFLQAFALFELGKLEELLPAFLRAALNCPRAARMLLGERSTTPKSHTEAEDHNTGVDLLRNLHVYLKEQSRPAKKFFRGLIREPRVIKLLDESIAVVRRWHDDRSGDRTAFERMSLMHSREFAEREARRLRDLVVAPGQRGLALN